MGLVWLLLSALGLGFGAIVVPGGGIVSGLAAAPVAAVYAVTEALAATVLIGFLFALPGILLFSLLGGVFEVFRSVAWALTYLELLLRKARSLTDRASPSRAGVFSIPATGPHRPYAR